MKCTSCHAPCMVSDPCCPHCGGAIDGGADNPNILRFCVLLFTAVGTGLAVALAPTKSRGSGDQIMIAGAVGAIAGALGYLVGRIATAVARRA